MNDCSLATEAPETLVVLDCGSPLPLFRPLRAFKSGRRLPQSKTLARHPDEMKQF